MRPIPSQLILLTLALGLTACPPGPGAQSNPNSDPTAPVDATAEAQDQDENNAAVDAGQASTTSSYCNPEKTILISYDPLQKKYVSEVCNVAQGERCVKTQSGSAKCAPVKTSCISKNTIKFTYGSGAGKDEWTEGCNYLEDIECALSFPDAPWKCAQLDDYLNYFCVKPSGEAAQCAKAEGSCVGPKTVQHIIKDISWTTACPSHKPFCSEGTCLPLSPECKDSDKSTIHVFDDEKEIEYVTKVVVINGVEQEVTYPVIKKDVADGSAEKFGWVTMGETSYQDVCKDGKYLVEQLCIDKTVAIKEGVQLESTTSLTTCTNVGSDGQPTSVCTTKVPSTFVVDCSTHGVNFACIVDHCGPISEKETYDPPDTPADTCNPDVENCGPYIPPFDCDAPFEEVAELFPDSQIEGQPGFWHVSTCSTPKNLYKNKWVTHLICYDANPDKPGTELLTDTVKCGEGGVCQSGLCNGEIPKYCVATFENQSVIDPLKPGFAETGYGETVTQHPLSSCVDLTQIRYPLCETKAPTIYWSDVLPCPAGHVCVAAADGAACKPVEECTEGAGKITVSGDGFSNDLNNSCTGGKAPGKQGTTTVTEWECSPDEEKFESGPAGGTACPAGTACCVHKTKGLGCHADCPNDPPPPDPVAMDYLCEDNDPDQDPELPGEIVIDGKGTFSPGTTEDYSIKDKCDGPYTIEQFFCKASSASGQLGQGKALLLGNTGSKNCTQILLDWGVVLKADDVGLCKTDPATGSGICFVYTPDPPETPEPGESGDTPADLPPEVKSSLECDESSDPDNDPYQSGYVTIKDGNQYKTKEDYCVGDLAVIQYECGVDENAQPTWVAVPALNCPTGCAQGKCCEMGSIEIAFDYAVCVEDLQW